ncbi:MAG: glycosidase [Gammaproteobacteria bacterium]|nr:glycosidase [Gammaproteobacteria bacterium]NNJ49205.1 glycosidase [Gammaproteobacteria bacterium]
MNKEPVNKTQTLPGGVMFNAYPDSIGKKLADTLDFLKKPELKDAFSLFYILPTFFHSDLDRGFSIIDYDINEELISPQDLDDLNELGIDIKLDLVLNHLSVRSPQFVDLLQRGKESPYRDFFIDWNEFWKDHGSIKDNDHVLPDKEHLEKLFMRKPDLPILKIRFPDGSVQSYWNTFYQKVEFDEIVAQDFTHIEGLDLQGASDLAKRIKVVIQNKGLLESADMEDIVQCSAGLSKEDLIAAVCHKRDYLGQMDLNARSELVWEFYDETLHKLSQYGAKIIRLDAFAYLHKEPGQPNFFNRPGTWEYLERLRGIAKKYELIIFPEIHAEYGAGIHEEISQQGYPIYDFFFPGLVINALEQGNNEALLRWIADIQSKELQTINMLGSHDGIPVLDLKGKRIDGSYRPGLLPDEQIEATIERIIERGGLTKNLYAADGKKIDYYQVNATYFSALGEDEQKLRLARAIQMFMPGVPQVWYLDLFAGKNDYAAAQSGHTAGHKEINRTTLNLSDIKEGLKKPVVLDQLELIRLRNTSPAFKGEMKIGDTDPQRIHITWQHPEATVTLKADLRNHSFTVYHGDGKNDDVLMSFES